MQPWLEQVDDDDSWPQGVIVPVQVVAPGCHVQPLVQVPGVV
jgi:hypothetical protein